MDHAIVEMRNIIKIFPGTKALDRVDLFLRKGEIHALAGENGAGKSTLMKVLTGQLLRDGGDIYFDGKPVNFSTPIEAMTNRIVLVPQELNLIPEASVAENIFLGNEILKGSRIDWKKQNREAEHLLEIFKLNIDVSRPVKYLSAAYQQIISIARALTYSPKVLILDEPTAVLTEKESAILFQSMHQLKSEGTALVFISHHLDEIMEHCDRITILRDGRNVREVMVNDITKEQIINDMAGKTIKQTTFYSHAVHDEIFFETKGLTRIGEFNNISFKLYKGEILGVAGLVGAGRTEIFQCIYGITTKDSGEIRIEGEVVDISSPAKAMRCGMGYVSEERRTDGIIPLYLARYK